MISTRIKYFVIGAFTATAVAVTSFLGHYFSCARPQIRRGEVLAQEKEDLERRLAVAEENQKRAINEVVASEISNFGLEQKVSASPASNTITIKDLVLADSVSDDFTRYVQRKSSVYSKEDVVLIYHTVHFLKPFAINGRYRIGFDEVHQLFDPNGRLVPSITENNSCSYTTSARNLYFHSQAIRTKVNAAALKPGTYTYRITAADQFKPSHKYVGEIKFTIQ